MSAALGAAMYATIETTVRASDKRRMVVIYEKLCRGRFPKCGRVWRSEEYSVPGSAPFYTPVTGFFSL